MNVDDEADAALARDDIEAYLRKHETKELLRLVVIGSVDDDRIPLNPGEKPRMEMVRFRTLGCYPLTGALKSHATTLPDIIKEMLLTKYSERQGRLIDFDEEGSMETKKREGYF